jgi:hypothetical protein
MACVINPAAGPGRLAGRDARHRPQGTPCPGAQLRFTDFDGHRFTAFATDAKKGQLAGLELRHRRRARCEDRIRCAKDTGLRNLPLKGFAANQVWCEVVALACELLAWTQMLALAGGARRWEPKLLRLRLLSVAGRLARSGRRLRFRLAEHWPWAANVTAAVTRLQALPSGYQPQHPCNTEGASARARGTPPSRRASRAPPAPENKPQPNTSGQQITEAIEASALSLLASPQEQQASSRPATASQQGNAPATRGKACSRARTMALRAHSSDRGETPQSRDFPLDPPPLALAVAPLPWQVKPARKGALRALTPKDGRPSPHRQPAAARVAAVPKIRPQRPLRNSPGKDRRRPHGR